MPWGRSRQNSLKTTEAQIFYALALAVAEDPADKTYADRLKAGTILEKLVRRRSRPIPVSRITLSMHMTCRRWRSERSSDGATLCRHCTRCAPCTAHAIAHIYPIGIWQESIASNLGRRSGGAGARVKTAEELHASDYEAYAYLQTGQDEAAASDCEFRCRKSHHASIRKRCFDRGRSAAAGGYFALAAIPARYALERQDWQQAEGTCAAGDPVSLHRCINVVRPRTRLSAIGAREQANVAATALRQIKARLLKASERYWAQQVEIQAPRSQHGLRWRRARKRKHWGRWNRRHRWKIGRKKVW